jgi:hypothetical protein
MTLLGQAPLSSMHTELKFYPTTNWVLLGQDSTWWQHYARSFSRRDCRVLNIWRRCSRLWSSRCNWDLCIADTDRWRGSNRWVGCILIGTDRSVCTRSNRCRRCIRGNCGRLGLDGMWGNWVDIACRGHWMHKLCWDRLNKWIFTGHAGISIFPIKVASIYIAIASVGIWRGILGANRYVLGI